MDQLLEQLIWKGEAVARTQTFGLGSQFILPIGRNNTGIITKIVYSPFTFQPGPGNDLITAPLQEIILSDGRRSIRKVLKNFDGSVIKGDNNLISQGQSVTSQLYFPFYADAPLYINLNQNNITVQLSSPFNQVIRPGLDNGYEAILQAAIDNGHAIPSIDQQYWQNELYTFFKPFFLANKIFIFVNGQHDSGNIEFSRYDWAQPGIFYPNNGTPNLLYTINQGTGAGPTTGGFVGIGIPANNPGFLAYKLAFSPRSIFIAGNTTTSQTIETGTNRNGSFLGIQARGFNQTLGPPDSMNRPNPNRGLCQTFLSQQTSPSPEIEYYLDGLFLDLVPQTANQVIPPSENNLVLGRQGQTVSLPVNSVQFLGVGLIPGQIEAIDTVVKEYCTNLAKPAPVPVTPTGIIEAFLTVHYIEINGNHLNRL